MLIYDNKYNISSSIAHVVETVKEDYKRKNIYLI